MLHKKSILKGAALALLAAGTGTATAQTAGRKLLDPANLDTKTRPVDNFYRYANGAWLDANPIPSTETRWGSFNELQEGNYAALLTLLEESAANKSAAPGSREGKIGTFYRNGMDSAAIDKMGLAPLKPHFARIDAIAGKEGIIREVAFEHSLGIGPLFGFYVGPDDKNVTRMICNFYQGGLGMPDRDYYFKTDARSSAIREAYQRYLNRMLGLMGNDAASASRMAAAIFKLETALAGASLTRVEMRDPYALYNKFAVSSLDKEIPGVNWNELLSGLKVKGQDSILIGMPAFFREVGKSLSSTELATWKTYLKFHLFNNTAPFLSSAYDDARFDFYGRTIRGQKEQRPRWKRVLNTIDGSIGELLGQLYVDRNFKPEAKARMLELVNNLQQTYADRIKRLDWMSEPTKQKALAKLNTFMKKIGYPDKWKDYSTLQITGKDYLANVLAASAFEYNYNVSKLGRPVDRTEWGMTPPTVNAYYNPAFNEIVFPAGILQYPFFDFKADDAVNYGGIGAVIGHEMTHGFDDQGRQYDASGNLKDWWTSADSAAFMSRANMVVKQYNDYTVLDTVHVNGELTLGENLADLGGLAIAYEAFQKTEQAKKGEKIDGFTPNQRFFLSWAQVWRANTRPEEMASRIVTDPHSPNELRGNGPLTNMTEFYEAFGVKKGDKMWREPAERAKVW